MGDISEGMSFLNAMGANLGTVALVGGGYLIYKFCGGSKCGYTSEHGFNISFGDTDDEDTDDEEDLHLKEMMKLMVKRKSIKVKQKKDQKVSASLSSKDKVPTIRIPIDNSPRFASEIKSDI